MKTSCIRPLFVFLCFLAAVTAGCDSFGNTGGPRGTLQGQITCNGKPFPKGTMLTLLLESTGSLVVAELDPDGNFRVSTPDGPEIPVGTYKVSVVPPEDPDSSSPQRMVGGKRGDLVSRTIPGKYRNPETSGLTVDVHKGDNEFVRNLKG